MSLNHTPQTVTAAEYDAIFERERQHEYPMVDAFVQGVHIVDRQRLEAAARVLCCPMKAAAPNWQHGRVLYAVARQYLAGWFLDATDLSGPHKISRQTEPLCLLDIGTAKGFSALCLLWALLDSGCTGSVTSVDVLPPLARVRRNTIAEVHALRTLFEILAPWPEAAHIHFEESTGIEWLTRHPGRVHVAFVDGKHTGEVVKVEGDLLAARQSPGDVAIFDDVQIDGVGKAVKALETHYSIEYLRVLPGRAYGIAVRK